MIYDYVESNVIFGYFMVDSLFLGLVGLVMMFLLLGEFGFF